MQDHFEQLETVWQDRYAPPYGFWRPYLLNVIYRYLDFGDLCIAAADPFSVRP